MFVIGTAGHVDHGKSTLIEALTGVDPDRLQEEKERGMTIDLGFAWLRLPSGREVSIVDVPGHERFIKNMLAGVGGIDLALLVVAADEAVMPQTREHLAILDLLQVKQGLVAVTKSDLVDKDWQELVAAEVEDTLKGTSLEGAPIKVVSAHTGQGLPELLSTVDSLLETTDAPKDLGRPRLPVDRSFVISGFGAVATGTLTDGTLSVGQEVELVLAQKRARIRGLQTHRKSEETAQPGTRTAVNLSGISHEEIKRGEVVTIPGWLKPTKVMDVRLRLIAGLPRPLKHSTTVSVHIGTSETLSRVLLLDRDQMEPGETGWAQFRLQQPIAAVKDDYFVIRSSETTLGGGNIVDPSARRHRRKDNATLKRLAVLQEGTSEQVLLEALESLGHSTLESLARRANVSLDQAFTQIQTLAKQGQVLTLGTSPVSGNTVLIPRSLWTKMTEKVRDAIARYHRQFPLRQGVPREEVRSRLGLEDNASALVLSEMVKDGLITEEDAWVQLPDHRVTVSQAQRQQLDQYLNQLESVPHSPPTEDPLETDLLNVLVEEGKVVKVSDSVVFTTQAYREMVDIITGHLQVEGKITVAQVRDLLDTSRKYALALMEHLDQQRITRRVGDERVLR